MEARRRLAEAQLVLQLDQARPPEAGAKVIQQRPQPGERVALGTPVLAAFELPRSQLVPVPSIIGADAAEAQRRLAGAHLVLQLDQRPPLLPGARVVWQSPQPGELVPPGERIAAAFAVSQPQLVPVPSIIGDNPAEAEQRLARAQLVLQPGQRQPLNPDAKVVRQNPQPGEQVRRGTQVVAAFEVPPPQLVSVPSIIGVDLTEAQRRVAATQLVLQPEQRTPSAPNARVVRQSPQPGQMVAPGTQVVAAFEAPPPQLVSVPSIVGADLAEAQRRLAASRLVLQPEQRTPANAGAKVVQQNPQPGQQVPPGTQVVAAFEVPSSPWTAITWLGGALALVAIGALVGLWRWVARMRKSRPDSRTSSLLRVHARKDPGRPSIQLNNDPAGPAFGIRVTRPPPVITLTEHDHA